MKLLIGLSLLSMSVISMNANAELINSDWKTAGDNLVVTDTLTGLEWLSFEATDEFSWTQVASQVGQGGLFEGWELASVEQINVLTDVYLGFDTKVKDNINRTTKYSPSQYYDDFENAFGYRERIQTSTRTTNYVFGMHEKDGVPLVSGVSRRLENGNFYSDIFYQEGYTNVGLSVVNPYLGAYLVRKAQVSDVSAATGTFGAAISLAGFFAMRKRHRK